ncbi:hypothetical protein VULLAG_LOCUS1255 [Vulpes lagopus]
MTFPEADIFLKSGNCLRRGHFPQTVFSSEAPRPQPVCPVPAGPGPAGQPGLLSTSRSPMPSGAGHRPRLPRQEAADPSAGA